MQLYGYENTVTRDKLWEKKNPDRVKEIKASSEAARAVIDAKLKEVGLELETHPVIKQHNALVAQVEAEQREHQEARDKAVEEKIAPLVGCSWSPETWGGKRVACVLVRPEDYKGSQRAYGSSPLLAVRLRADGSVGKRLFQISGIMPWGVDPAEVDYLKYFVDRDPGFLTRNQLGGE